MYIEKVYNFKNQFSLNHSCLNTIELPVFVTVLLYMTNDNNDTEGLPNFYLL